MSAPDVSPMNLPSSAFDPSAVNDVAQSSRDFPSQFGSGVQPAGPADPTQAPSAGGVNPLPATATQASQVGDIAQSMSQAAQGDKPTDPPLPFWRSVLVGALSGIESHLKGAAKGFYEGGIPGAIAGAADPSRPAQIYRNQGVVNQAQADTASAHAASALEEANFGAQNDQIQLAQAHINFQTLLARFNSMPKTFQEHLLPFSLTR